MILGFPLIFCSLIFHVCPRIFYPTAGAQVLDIYYGGFHLDRDVSYMGYQVDWENISSSDVRDLENTLHFGTNKFTVPVLGRWRGTYRLPVEVIIRPLQFETVNKEEPSGELGFSDFTLAKDGEKAYCLLGSELWIWNVSNACWEAKLTSKDHAYALGPWAVSPDENSLSLVVNEKLILWGLKEKQTLKNFSVPAEAVKELDFSIDGDTLLVLYDDDTIQSLDVHTGEPLSAKATSVELASREGSHWSTGPEGSCGKQLMSEYAVFHKEFGNIVNSATGEKLRFTPFVKTGRNRLSGWSAARLERSEKLWVRSPQGETFIMTLNGRVRQYFPCASRSQALVQFRQDNDLRLVDLKTGEVLQTLSTKAVGLTASK